MATLKSLQVVSIRLTVWHDGSRDPAVDDRCMLEIEREEGAPGLRRMSFYMGRGDLDKLCKGGETTLTDISHRLHARYGQTTFYDWETPNASSGVVSVPFFCLDTPRIFYRYLARIARVVWRESRAAEAAAKLDGDRYGSPSYWCPQRVECQIPLGTVARMQECFASGTGTVEELTTERFEAESASDPGLAEQKERLTTIARNSTRNRYQRALYGVSNDGDGGYYFETYDPRGRRIMNGAVIRREREESGHRWSMHT